MFGKRVQPLAKHVSGTQSPSVAEWQIQRSERVDYTSGGILSRRTGFGPRAVRMAIMLHTVALSFHFGLPLSAYRRSITCRNYCRLLEHGRIQTFCLVHWLSQHEDGWGSRVIVLWDLNSALMYVSTQLHAPANLSPVIHRLEGWVGRRTGLDPVQMNTPLCVSLEPNPESLSCSSHELVAVSTELSRLY
jgi:hypothetical protein